MVKETIKLFRPTLTNEIDFWDGDDEINGLGGFNVYTF